LKRVWQKITHWELWPFYFIYAPLGFVWLWYALKARAFWFFSPANPTLDFAGFEGEGKRQMYQQIPKVYLPVTIYIHHQLSFEEVEQRIAASGIPYPFAVKPEIGMQGILFRKINNPTELKNYHQHIPAEYLVQELVTLPMEFSVFHIRYPGNVKGKVTGFILKDYLHVVGDGSSSLINLILNHPKAKHRETEMRAKHANHLQQIIPQGEKYYLSIAGNHNRGARFINLHTQIDQALTDTFDAISNQIGQFYYGRYDLKCTSIEDLKAGKNILILEYNGAGAEPNHIYDCGMSYARALGVIINHWEDLYKIAKINHQKGVPYWGFWKGRKHLRAAAAHFSFMKQYDLEY
jgi:hypothetical protein